MSSRKLTQEKALIFRIAHKDNVPAVMANGCLCRSVTEEQGGYRDIGNLELIEKRKARDVPCEPDSTLSDYVPFYFTPLSPMLYDLKTGHGVTKRPMSDIIILVSSLHRLLERGNPFVFTTVDWLVDRCSVPPDVDAVKDGLRRWPGGEGSGERKVKLFDDRSLGLALEALSAASLIEREGPRHA